MMRSPLYEEKWQVKGKRNLLHCKHAIYVIKNSNKNTLI